MKWTPEAERMLKRIPIFVRKRVKKEVEKWALSRGWDQITAERFIEAKAELLDKASRAETGYSVEGCFGCRHAVTDSKSLMQQIEEILNRKRLTEFMLEKTKGNLKHHNQFRVIVSECPNACSRVHLADLGLVGRVILTVHPERCTACGNCVSVCKDAAITLEGGLHIDESLCLACGECAVVCQSRAITVAEKGYRVLAGGKLGRRPRLATEIVPFAKKEDVIDLLGKVINLFMRENREGERLGTIVQRLGWEEFLERLNL